MKNGGGAIEFVVVVIVLVFAWMLFRNLFSSSVQQFSSPGDNLLENLDTTGIDLQPVQNFDFGSFGFSPSDF